MRDLALHPGRSRNPAAAATGRRAGLSATAPGRLLFIAVLLASVVEAMACPVCTERRLLQSYWHFKVFALLVAAPVLVTFTRLHVLRVLYTFIPLALLNIKLQLLYLWYDHPVANTDGVPVNLITSLLIATSLAAPVLICCLGRVPFYRKDGKKGFLVWQPFAYCAVLFLAAPYLRV